MKFLLLLLLSANVFANDDITIICKATESDDMTETLYIIEQDSGNNLVRFKKLTEMGSPTTVILDENDIDFSAQDTIFFFSFVNQKSNKGKNISVSINAAKKEWDGSTLKGILTMNEGFINNQDVECKYYPSKDGGWDDDWNNDWPGNGDWGNDDDWNGDWGN